MQPLSRNRDFVLLWTGQALSSLGSQMGGVAYPLLTLALTHSAAKTGVVAFAGALPYTLFVLPAGVLVDRWNRKRVMIVADVGRALALAVLVALLWQGHPSYLVVAAIAFVETSMLAFFNIAETGAVGQVVPAAQLPEAMARDGARMFGALVIGPPIGGALFGVARVLPFLADAISYLFSVLTILAMRTPFQLEREEPRGTLRTEFVEGVRWLWNHSFLRACAVMFALGNFAGSALFLVVIVIAKRQGLSPGAIGALLSIYGVVGLVGALVSPRLQRLLSMRAIVVGSQFTGAALAAFLVFPNVWVLLAGALPYGIVGPTLNSVVIGYRIAITPDRLRGRVNSVARFVAQLISPLGPLVAGLLLSVTSERVTVGFFAAWLVAVGVGTLLSKAIRAAPNLSELSGTGPVPAP